MRLLYITNGINGAGGLERVLSIKASYFAEKLGHEVTILSLNDAHLNPFYDFSDKIKMVSIPVGGNPIQYILAYKKGIQQVVDQIQYNKIFSNLEQQVDNGKENTLNQVYLLLD